MAHMADEDAHVVGVLTASPAAQLAQIKAWGLPPATLLLLMNACENRCFFCANDGVLRPAPGDITRRTDIEARLHANRGLGVSTLCIVGTEPSAHPDFDYALQLSREVGFERIELMTSGLRLAQPGVAERWFDAGICSVAVPLYGATAAVHDAVVGMPSFERTVTGLDRAQAAGMAVRVHTLALTRTLPFLAGLVEFVHARWAHPVAIAPVRPKETLFDYATQAPTLNAVADAVDGLNVTLIGFPACVSPQTRRGAALVMDLYFRGQATRFAPACQPCLRQADCPGIVLGELGRAQVRPFVER